jgi:hypothetical protein
MISNEQVWQQTILPKDLLRISLTELTSGRHRVLDWRAEGRRFWSNFAGRS